MINSFKSYLVEEEKTVYFTFGRMNPPTIGHEKLLDVMARKAGKHPYKVYLSQSQDAKKNPLDYQTKVKTARKMFPRHARQIMIDRGIRNVFDIASKLYEEGYKNVAMVVGSDRVREFDVLLRKYNGVKAKHGFYNFQKITVISAGERDPDADGAEGMSASKMRAAASDGDFSQFAQGLPKSISNSEAKKIYNTIRSAMGLKEQKTFKNKVQFTPVNDLRESYIDGKLYEVGDTVVVKESGEVGTVKMLGSNYVIVESTGTQHRKWLDAVELVDQPRVEYVRFNEQLNESAPQDPDISDRKGTQPAKYHAGLKKSTKAKRDAQFKKQAKMADDDPKAYKPAPGDKTAKTKPSVYTTAVKKMMGENYNAWTHDEPIKYAKHLTKTFGQPDEMTNSQLCWFAKDGFKRIVIKDEYILHGSPAPHYDFIYCYIDLKVPEKYAKALAESSGSIMIDYLKGEVGARCGSITANATTLNYVLDVVADRVVPSKKEYEKRILSMRKMFENGQKYTTEWWPDESGDADPKNKYYAEGLKEYKMEMPKKKTLRFKSFGEADATALDIAKQKIDREKKADSRKHDRMLDRARMTVTRRKNRETK